MKQKLQGKVGWLSIGLIVGSLFGGVAVAKVIIPDHSVGWKSLTKGLQKRLSKNLLKPIPGPKGDKGDTGATGAQGQAADVPGTPEQPKFSIPYIRSIAVSSVTGSSAILEGDIGTDGAEEGIYYQFQLVTDPDDFRPEVSCPWRNVPPYISCLGGLLDGGSGDISREPEDLPTRDLLPEEGDRHVRLEVQGLQRETEYHYRLIAVERKQGVDTIHWISPPVYSPSGSFETGDFDSPRAYGWVAPFDEFEETLKRNRNSRLVEPDGDPNGIWCIAAANIDPTKMLVQLTPVQEPHVSLLEPEVPVVRWQTSPNHCDGGQVEVETALYSVLEDEYVPTDVPFTFLIEEGR